MAPPPEVTAESVAAWILTGAWCYRQGEQESGGPVLPGSRRQDTTATATAALPRARRQPQLTMGEVR